MIIVVKTFIFYNIIIAYLNCYLLGYAGLLSMLNIFNDYEARLIPLKTCKHSY